MISNRVLLVPYEVWEDVLWQLPSHDAPPAMALNYTTYNIVLDKLYRVIHWRCLDEDMIKSLIMFERTQHRRAGS